MNPITNDYLSTIVPKNIAALGDAHRILTLMHVEDNIGALELTAIIKTAEATLAQFRAAIVPITNADFQALQLAEPDKKQWITSGGLGIIKKYTPRAVWEYPQKVKELEARLKIEQETAKANKTATKKTAEIKPESALFSISLTKK